MDHIAQYLREVRDASSALSTAEVEALCDELVPLRARGGRPFVLGAGGSPRQCQPCRQRSSRFVLPRGACADGQGLRTVGTHDRCGLADGLRRVAQDQPYRTGRRRAGALSRRQQYRTQCSSNPGVFAIDGLDSCCTAHCRLGVHRTTTFPASLLAAHGLSPGQSHTTIGWDNQCACS